ncbi:glutaredoxin domain-containing protein [Corynebacterium dentalis]|uniref:glutaredoxin domain-containing protein n=1 Tax=Corynebacterium dentalis TaxID=2014528 RepID=UPI00289E6619|nr:glutaredoxin domain-containing protein [Corynebacterium dentalis]
MYTATVYTRPGCMKCRATTRKLQQLGVFVTEEQLDDHPDKIQLMRDEERTALPLVEVVDPSGELFRWSDMSTTDLDALAFVITNAA